jgi:hypothetical protein
MDIYSVQENHSSINQILKEKFETNRLFKGRKRKFTCITCKRVHQKGYFTQKIVIAPPVIAFQIKREKDQVIDIPVKLDLRSLFKCTDKEERDHPEHHLESM